MEVFYAIILSGIPILLISFGLFFWAYKTGVINPIQDQMDEIKTELKELSSGKEKKQKSGNFVMDKWFEFGGGYYGVMALITFLYAELFEVMDIVTKIMNLNGKGSLLNSLVSFFINFAIESFTNIIVALTWWRQWHEILPIEKGLIWLIVTYIAYLSGEWLAKRQMNKQ